MALNSERDRLPYVLGILDLSPVGLGSPNLICVALIGATPIISETRDIMLHFL